MAALSRSGRRLPKPVVDEAISYLAKGEPLPEDFRNILFETKREYDLTYGVKTREADVLANTMAVPFQPVKTFGEVEDGWRNLLVFGDNLQALKTLLRMKENGELRNADGSLGVRLCYIDPPFATRREFSGAKQERAYQDKVVGADFIEFLRKRLIFIRELLSDNGSLFVHMDQRKVHYAKIVLDEVFGESSFRNEIVWKRTSAHSDAALLGSVHETILYYTKGSTPVWNPQFMPYEDAYVEQYYRYREPDGRRFMSGDLGAAGLAGGGYDYEWKGVRRIWRVPVETMKRLDSEGLIFYTKNGVPRIKRHLDESKGQPLADVWTDIQPVVSWSKERVGYPTQKPVPLLARIITMASNPGDLVLDAFVGSGTTLVASESLPERRRWIGIDCGKLAIYTTQERLLRIGADGRTLLKTAPFALANAGLYDYGLLRSLPWTDFRAFALELFQCRDETHSVGRVLLDGYRGLDHVLVFNFQKHRGAVLNEAYVNDLHKALGDRVGRRFFIIAPAGSVNFLQDYVEVSGGRHPVRYFILRIPYSIIDELHEQGFTRLQQPVSASAVNETVDSVGFDFIQPPLVKCSYRRLKDQLQVRIVGFEAEAMSRSADSPNGLDALAMVMVDYDYDGAVFDVDDVFYAEDLRRLGYLVSIPVANVGDQMMLIYVDVYGNEHKEVKSSSDFPGSGAK